MADHKPPRLADGERETLIALLQFQRESLVRKVSGLTDEQARQRLVGSDTTLLWLVKHLAWAELRWIRYSFAGDGTAIPDDTVTAADTLAAAVDSYRTVWSTVDSVVAASSLDDLCRNPPPEVNLRWILMHLLEETARHAGHADILRELIDGQTGR